MTSVQRRLSEDNTARCDRREVFRDCALIEIIHLHDCLRGAVKALEHDVQVLTSVLRRKDDGEASLAYVSTLADLEGRVFGRFKVIWSVFRAHSSAEDEFIWPALRRKTQQIQVAAAHEALASTSNKIPPDDEEDLSSESVAAAVPPEIRLATNNLVQEEYEEDHADEERMFSEMDSLFRQLKERLSRSYSAKERAGRTSTGTTMTRTTTTTTTPVDSVSYLTTRIMDQTQRLSNHLLRHLEKEELQCMPLVLKHLDKTEIHDLVGQIMGRRSADTITHIMTMAVQSLEEEERNEMIKYMKQSMRNTFFDQWLLASGWGSSADEVPQKKSATESKTEEDTQRSMESNKTSAVDGATHSESPTNQPPSDRKRPPSAENSPVLTEKRARLEITTQAELERLIRAIATNPALSAQQKNTTIQGLRDSVWKKNQAARLAQDRNSPPAVAVNEPLPGGLPLLSQEGTGLKGPQAPVAPTHAAVVRVGPSAQNRALPPVKYFKRKEDNNTIELVWSNDTTPSNPMPSDGSVPTFSASELAPTFHDGVAGAVFGCPHYARACKLRHPKSGRLYTCRLCCDHQRELPMREDEPLDRYAVSEVMCMKCTTLQPADDRCINDDCEFSGKPFARYFCRICHLYDDGSRPIFHCPYCNTCRLGLGLGIDYRHCMRCNACVSLNDKEHRCIPQKLQGDCPVCHEALFQSTEPLRGVRCGHVMHLSCFTQYRRGRYTCPLCCKSMEDMKDHFALLDAAIRMQPMPMSFLQTQSLIYCQDCGQTGQVPFHFVGLKCPQCSSYNTREMGRVQN